MSRSYKKTPICGYTTAESDHLGKRCINRRFRKKEKLNLHNRILLDDFDNFNTTDINQIPKYGYLPKDGKQYLLNCDPDYLNELMRK